MKKVLLLIGTALASFSLSFAQAPQQQEMPLKSDNTLRGQILQLPEGFTYLDRTAADDDNNVAIVGSGKENIGFHHAGAIELPAQAGQVLKSITFFTTSKDKGKVFVASRAASGQLGTYTIEQVKEFETKTLQMNTVEFAKPVTTEEGKVYAVGYEVKSSQGGGQEQDFPSYPMTFVKQGNVPQEAAMLGIMDAATPIIGAEGSPLALKVEGKFGALAIVVQGDNLASTFNVASEFIPTVYSQEGRILIQGTVDSFMVFDATGRLVAQNSDTVLPTGTYVVKARNGQMESVTKVAVK